jgi:hypothetical protein
MSRSESVPTSKRLRLRDQHHSNDLDDDVLDELAACLDSEDENTDGDRVDAIELALDECSAEASIAALGELVDAGYDVQVRDLIVEISR